MKRITSRQHPVVGQYRRVARGESTDLLLLDGPHLLAEALASDIVIEHVVVASDALDSSEAEALLARVDRAGAECVVASSFVMAAVSPVRSSSPIVALARRPADGRGRVYAGPTPLAVVACGIQDPGNLGAIVRVAEAAGASGVVVVGASADPFGWKALRGSMGSALRLAITVRPHVDDALAEARSAGCRIVAAVARDGTPLAQAALTGAVAIVVGGEGAGLPQHVLDAVDERLTIPMQAPVDSLNVAVATALIVFEARRQRTMPI